MRNDFFRTNPVKKESRGDYKNFSETGDYPKMITKEWLDSLEWRAFGDGQFELSSVGIIRRTGVNCDKSNKYRSGYLYCPQTHLEGSEYVAYRLYFKSGQSPSRINAKQLFKEVFQKEPPSFMFVYKNLLEIRRRCIAYNEGLCATKRDKLNVNKKGMSGLGIFARRCHDCGKPTTDYRCSACNTRTRNGVSDDDPVHW